MTNFRRNMLGGAALIAVTVGLWWGWLGHDTTYYVDPETGFNAGPYTPAQVAACALSLIAVGAVAALLLWPWLVAAVMTVSFTIAWSVQAAATDETGLWGVGAMLLLWGMGASSLLIAYGTWGAQRLLRRRGRGAQVTTV